MLSGSKESEKAAWACGHRTGHAEHKGGRALQARLSWGWGGQDEAALLCFAATETSTQMALFMMVVNFPCEPPPCYNCKEPGAGNWLQKLAPLHSIQLRCSSAATPGFVCVCACVCVPVLLVVVW